MQTQRLIGTVRRPYPEETLDQEHQEQQPFQWGTEGGKPAQRVAALRGSDAELFPKLRDAAADDRHVDIDFSRLMRAAHNQLEAIRCTCQHQRWHNGKVPVPRSLWLIQPIHESPKHTAAATHRSISYSKYLLGIEEAGYINAAMHQAVVVDAVPLRPPNPLQEAGADSQCWRRLDCCFQRHQT